MFVITKKLIFVADSQTAGNTTTAPDQRVERINRIGVYISLIARREHQQEPHGPLHYQEHLGALQFQLLQNSSSALQRNQKRNVKASIA